VVIAPGLREAVANAVAERWQALGPANVTVTLEADAEVVRLGVGDLSALELLEKTAQLLGAILRRQQALGIGVVVSDDNTLVFSPTPRLAAADGVPTRTNAVLLSGAAFDPHPVVAKDQDDAPLFDAEGIGPESIMKVKEDLKKNPPQPVAAAEVIRVFNAFFEFVELKLEGTAVERRTVPIPNELLGLAKNDDLRERIRTSFRLIGDEDQSRLSGRELDEFKRSVVKQHLIALKGYGNIVLRSLKPDFVTKVTELEARVNEFRNEVGAYLQAAIDRNREQLKALTRIIHLSAGGRPARRPAGSERGRGSGVECSARTTPFPPAAFSPCHVPYPAQKCATAGRLRTCRQTASK
jgi:hypothetical protein